MNEYKQQQQHEPYREDRRRWHTGMKTHTEMHQQTTSLPNNAALLIFQQDVDKFSERICSTAQIVGKRRTNNAGTENG